jgi:DNA-directed RNA polymerase subunit N (RpoN/RPB10)
MSTSSINYDTTDDEEEEEELKQIEEMKQREQAELLLPVRCLNGHVVSRMDKIEKFREYQKLGYPMEIILDKLGFSGIKKICCRCIFLTTVDVEEK